VAVRTSQIDAKTSLYTGIESSRRNLVEAFDHVDATVELLEAPELMSMLAVPFGAPRDCRSECFEASVELRKLDVVSGDLGVEVSDAVFDLTASGGTGASADWADSVKVLLRSGAAPEGAISALPLVPARLGERFDLPGRLGWPVAEADA
jgi:hypothetical protein